MRGLYSKPLLKNFLYFFLAADFYTKLKKE